MAANPGGKLALRRNTGRHNTGPFIRTSQHSSKYTQSSHFDFGSFSKPNALKNAESQASSSKSTLQLAPGSVEAGPKPSYQPPSCMLHLELPLPPLPCSKYLLCQQSTGETTAGMAADTSSVNDAENQHREGDVRPGACAQGQLSSLPSPSFPLCKKPISVWSEEYVWTLLAGDAAQSCEQFGVDLGAGSSRISVKVAPSTEQTFEQLVQAGPASCCASVAGECTTTTSSSEPHITGGLLCTAKCASSGPSQRPPMLVPDAGTLSTCRPPPATVSSGTVTTTGVCPPAQNSVSNSSQSLSSLPVIDLTEIEDDECGDYEDQDFDRLFEDVDMAQFEESCLVSQSNDCSVTIEPKQDSELQPPSIRGGQNCSVSNAQADSRVEVYGDRDGEMESERVLLRTHPPSRGGKEKAGIDHRVEVEKSSVLSCPVCAVAFQPSLTQKEADAHIRQCLDAMIIVLD